MQETELKSRDPFADIVPLKTDDHLIDKTRSIILEADKRRKSRGQYGGLSLGSKRFHILNQNWGGLDAGTHIIGGDCLGKDTPVLMYDGSVKPVQEIQTGELLMGPDSQPRTVLSTCHRYGELHRVNQGKNNGSYIVNSKHILSVKYHYRTTRAKGAKVNWTTSEPFNLSVEEYYKKDKTFKSRVMGYKVPIEFNFQNVELDPYFLGIWLGDGNSNGPAITTMDPEIATFVCDYAKQYECNVRIAHRENSKASMYSITRGIGQINPLLNLLKQYNLYKNKHIPKEYLINSREIRLQVLAGIIDTDGSLIRDAGSYEIMQKSDQIAKDLVFLAQSLGLHATSKKCKKTCVNNGQVGIYNKIYISGDLSIVPIKIKHKQWVSAASERSMKNKLNHSITVEPIGPGDYYGFELDKDGLFLLGDFTVTHNTNLGKSSLIRMMSWDLIRNNPDIHLRFYTLDDSEDYFFSCMVAQAANVPINAVHKPEAFLLKAPTTIYSKEDYAFMVQRGHDMYQEFLQPHILEKFSFVGTDTLEDCSWNIIRKDIQETRAIIGDKQLVVVIDNLHDIEIPGFLDTNDRTEAVAREIDKAAKEMELVILGTVELKKNQQRRPIIDDIYGSRKWKYKARSIILLYSEVGAGKPHPRLYYERRDKPGEQCSVLEVHFAKSKVSEFKGRLFYEQITERGTATEVIGESAAYYASQIS